MKSLFGASPHRLRNSNSRDSQDGRRGNDGGEGKRKSFAFMKYSAERRSSESMKASREHARLIALSLSMNQPEAAPSSSRKSKSKKSTTNSNTNTASTFQPAFPEPAAFDDFNPFGHDLNNNSSSNNNTFGVVEEDFFAHPNAPSPTLDLFAQANAPPLPTTKAASSYQRKSSNASSSQRSFSERGNSFDGNESVATTSSAAYDMDFLPLQTTSQRDAMPPKRPSRGRPPRGKTSSTTGSEVSFGSNASSSIAPQWPSQSQATIQLQQPPPTPKSMSTFPSNSSMQSTFASTPPHHSSQMMISPPPSSGGGAGGAAARRRMRSQLRHASSGASLNGSETASPDGTPPASPSSSRRNIFSSNGSVGSSNGGGAAAAGTSSRNRVPSYTISGNFQSSPSPSMRGSGGGGASVCSSVADSDIDLFDSQHDAGGFTFDAFGLDASAIDREVQEALQALEGSKRGVLGSYTGNGTNTESTANTSTISKAQDTSGDDFAPQAWDSPPGSRRSTPTPKESPCEDDGFVDGFRVSKPSPLPLISVQRESPVSSERSSSLSSITDQNTEGAPRRNVFKEKAGFVSSSNGAPRRPRTSPAQPPKKQWVPPPGAVKILTPPRHETERRNQSQQPQQQQQQRVPQHTIEEDADNYWKEHLNEIPDDMFDFNSTDKRQQQPPLKEQAQPPNAANQRTGNTPVESQAKKFQSAAAKYAAPRGRPQPAAKYARESSFRKQKEEEEKKDDASEERDSHTDTTAATTSVVSEPSPHRQSEVVPASQHKNDLKLENLERLVDELQQSSGDEAEHEQKRVLSPSEQRKKELDEMRNGTSTPAFKSQSALHHVHHDSNKFLKPQQERANECSDQRTSFASLKERLKSSPAEHDQANRNISSHIATPQQSAFFNSQVSPQSGAKSEVGVSSFTRQKMKIASMTSSASKSEANYAKSPRQNSPQHSDVNTLLNRARGMTSGQQGTPKAGTTQASTSSAPSFMAVKLRKTGDETAEQPRQLTYRERREMELRELQQQGSGSSPQYEQPLSQAQKIAQNQQRQTFQGQEQRMGGAPPQDEERPPSQKKLTYRERRELELAKEREAKEQRQKAQEAPKIDVAETIRRRIAANKSKNGASPTNDSQASSSTNFSRDRLRPTGRSAEDQVQQSNSAGSEHDESIYAPTDEGSAHFQTAERLARNTLRANSESFEGHNRRSPRHSMPSHHSTNAGSSEGHNRSSPRHSMPAQKTLRFEDQEPSRNEPYRPAHPTGGLASLHAQLQQSSATLQDDEQPEPALESLWSGLSEDDREMEERLPEPPARGPAAAGGLSALHQQLKQLKDQESNEGEAQSEQKAAPKRIQAFVEGKPLDNLEVTAAHSHSSHSSPTRTPKATYAMLNAFLHGRESISANDEKATATNERKEDEESSHQSIGSPPKQPNATPSRSEGFSDGRPALKDDPKYARYFTMLKIGMPMDVVKHAMIRDNLDPIVMDGDHDKPACFGGVPLKDDPKYAKYFKMLKIGMPMEAVKHAMERDGLHSYVMDQDHNMPAEPGTGKTNDGPKEKDSHRRARLHWKPLGKVRRNSLWAKIDEDPELDNIEIDEEEFAELFQAEIQPDGQQAMKGKRIRSPRKGAAVRVIDPKRANNGGIILARLKMSHDDMADIVDRIDENGMTAEQIEHIIEYLPTGEERRALEAYMLEGGQDAAEKFDGLCECEKFMVSMMTVKHAKRKVRALLFKLQFETCLEALYQETHTVETSCDELSNSVRLRQLLGIVLTFGNRLNTAGKGKKKKAGAFTLDSLLKLNQAKAFDKKTTFLQYIVLIVQRNNELLLRFKDDLPTVFKADKVFWDQCISDLEEVENQLENVRRIALYQARHASKFRRKKKKHHDEDEDEESISDMSLSLEEEVEALRATPIGLFTLSAIKKVSFLRDRVEGTKVKFNKLLEYFGEDEKHLQPHELFNIIVKFSGDFEKAKEQIFESETKKKREERKRQSVNAKRQQTPNKDTTSRKPPPPPSNTMLRASSMQPNAGRLIQDMKRNGVTKEAPVRQQVPEERSYPAQHNMNQSGPAQHDHYTSERKEVASAILPRNSESSPSNTHQPQSRQHYRNDGAASYNPTTQSNGEEYQRGTHQQSRQQYADNGAAYQPSPQDSTSREYAQPQDTSSDFVEDIPRGMQDQGRMELSYDCPPVESKAEQEQAPPSTSTSATSTSDLRNKARARLQRRSSSPEDASDNEPTIARDILEQGERRPSAPDERSTRLAERAEMRRSSAPNVNSGASSASNLMRNKARAKRLMERKQRAMASPPPNNAV